MSSVRRRRNRRSPWLRPVAVILGVVASCYSAPYVIAGGMAVIDASNLTQNTATAIKTAQVLENAIKQVTQLTSLNGALGAAKQSINVQIPGWNNAITSTVGAAKPNFDSWKLPKSVAPSIGSPTQAAAFIKKAMDLPTAEGNQKPTSPDYDALKQIRVQRLNAEKEIAFRAMGAAENAINTADAASQTANNILSAPNQDLRTQVAQLTQAVVSVNQELILQRILIGTHLELQAASTIKTFPTTTMEGQAGTGQASGTDTNDDPFK